MKLLHDVRVLTQARENKTSYVSNTVTRAEATVENVRKGVLSHSPKLTKHLEDQSITWWPQGLNDNTFPSLGDKEIRTCQPFVSKVLAIFSKGKVKVKSSTVKGKVNNSKTSQEVKIMSIPYLSAPSTPTVGKKRPDCVFYEANKTGNAAITLIGEVKSGGDGNFADEDIGQLTDVTTRVMRLQPFRRYILSFLTDGRRFQFYRCRRVKSDYSFEYSSIFEGKEAWQVRYELEWMRI